MGRFSVPLVSTRLRWAAVAVVAVAKTGLPVTADEQVHVLAGFEVLLAGRVAVLRVDAGHPAPDRGLVVVAREEVEVCLGDRSESHAVAGEEDRAGTGVPVRVRARSGLGHQSSPPARTASGPSHSSASRP